MEGAAALCRIGALLGVASLSEGSTESNANTAMNIAKKAYSTTAKPLLDLFKNVHTPYDVDYIKC